MEEGDGDFNAEDAEFAQSFAEMETGHTVQML